LVDEFAPLHDRSISGSRKILPFTTPARWAGLALFTWARGSPGPYGPGSGMARSSGPRMLRIVSLARAYGFSPQAEVSISVLGFGILCCMERPRSGGPRQ
jgi:hypothetical protein